MLDIICSLQKNATTEALVWKCFQKKKNSFERLEKIIKKATAVELEWPLVFGFLEFLELCWNFFCT